MITSTNNFTSIFREMHLGIFSTDSLTLRDNDQNHDEYHHTGTIHNLKLEDLERRHQIEGEL